jgi:NADH-quinone oxidoreductase subunit J
MRVEMFTFLVTGAICLAGALGVVLLRNPVHNALSLIATLFGVAVLFISQEAYFLAAIQVIVYAGAIVILFLFVIMLLGVDKAEALDTEPILGQRPAAVITGVRSRLSLTRCLERRSLTGASRWHPGPGPPRHQPARSRCSPTTSSPSR